MMSAAHDLAYEAECERTEGDVAAYEDACERFNERANWFSLVTAHSTNGYPMATELQEFNDDDPTVAGELGQTRERRVTHVRAVTHDEGTETLSLEDLDAMIMPSPASLPTRAERVMAYEQQATVALSMLDTEHQYVLICQWTAHLPAERRGELIAQHLTMLAHEHDNAESEANAAQRALAELDGQREELKRRALSAMERCQSANVAIQVAIEPVRKQVAR